LIHEEDRMPASHRPTGRVTPKGVRPAGTTNRERRGERPDAMLGRSVVRNARPLPDRRSAARASTVRTGHRGGR
jgi:hypothetical protein